MRADLRLTQDALGTGLLLGVCVLLGIGMMAITNFHSQPFIERNELALLKSNVIAVLQPGSFNNNVLEDRIDVVAPDWLGSKKAVTVYRARMNGQPVAAVLNIVAPDGYSGPIALTVGVDVNLKVVGVRVMQHNETPGLGDRIESKKSKWLMSFRGRGIKDTPDEMWRVKKDGGEFDQFTGATITPRAVVKAIHRCLVYVGRHEAAIFASDAPGRVKQG